MQTGKVKIVGTSNGDRPLRGQDISVVLELPSGEEVLVPALSLVLRVGSRHEQAIATVEVPAHLVDVHGVELRAEAVVAPGGPESQWEEAMGSRPDLRTANADEYSEPVVVGKPMTLTEITAAGHDDGMSGQAFDQVMAAARFVDGLTDPMAELDAVIAAGGKVPDPS